MPSSCASAPLVITASARPTGGFRELGLDAEVTVLDASAVSVVGEAESPRLACQRNRLCLRLDRHSGRCALPPALLCQPAVSPSNRLWHGGTDGDVAGKKPSEHSKRVVAAAERPRPFRACGTPNCKLPAWHDGLCSADGHAVGRDEKRRDRKRKRAAGLQRQRAQALPAARGGGASADDEAAVEEPEEAEDTETSAAEAVEAAEPAETAEAADQAAEAAEEEAEEEAEDADEAETEATEENEETTVQPTTPPTAVKELLGSVEARLFGSAKVGPPVPRCIELEAMLEIRDVCPSLVQRVRAVEHATSSLGW